MQRSTSIDTVMNYIPEKIRNHIKAILPEKLSNVMEIRLRAGGPVYFVYADKICYLSQSGELSEMMTDRTFTVSGVHIREVIDRLCHYSMHSCLKQLKEGFFVVENGVRVGVSGTYSTNETPVLTDFTSVNFRISRCIEGCADDIFSKTYGKNIIICGGVSSGKTTVLRELCRLTGSFRKVTLIDERNEISCLAGGIPQNDVGCLTDVISGSPRSVGIMSAIRTLSPDVIFCDEIASQNDTEAILDGIGCGVKFVVTAHGMNFSDLLRRKEISCLLEKGKFDAAVFLTGSSSPGEVREIRRLKNVD